MTQPSQAPNSHSARLPWQVFTYINPSIKAGETYTLELFSFMTTWTDLYVKVDIVYQ